MEAMETAACHQLGKTSRVVKLLNRKNAKNVLKRSTSWKVSIFMLMIIPIETIEEKSVLIKGFAHTIGNFIVWWRIWIMKVW